MTSNWRICGICDVRNKSIPSTLWCFECEEGMCYECSDHHSISKATRHHVTVPVENYKELPKVITDISQNCDEHGQMFQLYCNKHEVPCCKCCILAAHKDCKELSDLDEVVKNVKSSSSFFELEQTAVELAENISKILKDREENISSLDKNERSIVKDIQMAKLNICNHLDRLEEVILHETAAHKISERAKCNLVLGKVKQSETVVTEIKDNLKILKEYPSNLTTFLGLRHFQHEISHQEQYVNKLLKSDDLRQTSLTWKLNPALTNFETSIKELGDITVALNPCQVYTSCKKNKQAQIMLQVPGIPTPINCDRATLKLKRVVSTEGNDVTGCTMLLDGRLVFTSYEDGVITVMNGDGSNKHQVLSKIPTFDVVSVDDRTTVALTSGHTGGKIQLLDLNTMKFIKQFNNYGPSDGVAYKNNKLWYCSREYGLLMLDLCSELFSKVNLAPNRKQNLISGCSYLAISGQKMYFTNKNKHTVTCCDLEGKVHWQIQDQTVLSFPLGVTVDGTGSLYVAGWKSNNVVRISPDGTSITQVLSHINGVDSPQALYYNVSTGQLIVANQSRSASIFNVTTSGNG